MSFLQPYLLFALPLAALPILIHLINQRRYQSMEWGAMRFLLAANRMSRGFARIRQWLIMAMRVLAIASLTFVISRPLASGWLGLTAGGQTDTTIVVLDRSPSMQQQTAGVTRLDAARRQLEETLSTLGSKRWVLIDSASGKPREIDSASALLDSPHTTGVSSEADLPALLQATHDYIKTNNPGRTEVWIASDLHENDWKAEDGRWASLRRAFLEFPQDVRFHLLAMTDAAGVRENLSVRVTDVRREETNDTPELVMSLEITRTQQDGPAPNRTVPLSFEIGGVRSTMNVELSVPRLKLKDHRVPLASSDTRDWGKVSLPADSNPADDHAYFVFDQAATERTLIVSQDELAVRPLQLAASIPPDSASVSEVQLATPGRLQTVAWEEFAMVIWQAALPEGSDAELLEQFVDRGGQVLFFPPRNPTRASFRGVSWNGWQESPDPLTPSTWRSDQGLLAKTSSGAALPVGRWKVRRHCTLEGEAITLAALPNGAPLVAHVAADQGGVYFCTTTADPRDSSMATDGVVLYVALRRAIARGMQSLGDARVQVAGRDFPPGGDPWTRAAGDDSPSAGEPLSTDYIYHQGVYENGEKLIAVNRPLAEDSAETVPLSRVDKLFEGLDYDRVSLAAADDSPLVREVWRLFLAAMMLALLFEALLCLPSKRTEPLSAGLSPGRPARTSGEKQVEAAA